MIKSNRFLVFIFLFFVFSFSFNVSATVHLKELRYNSYPEKTRIVAEVDSASRYEAKQFSPKTISLSIPRARSTLKQKYWAVNDGIVKDIVLLSYSSGSKIMINLEKELRDYHVFSIRDPHRIVIDIFNSGVIGEQTPSVFLKTVVIDPGHGGKDPGAIGPTGLKEKTITLDVAKRLKEILEARGIRVILTRDSDRFVSLRERVLIANSAGADLFLSIHCNAAFSSRAKGFESYFLSPASDDLARAVAAVENSVIMLETNSSNKDKEFLTILADLKYTEYRKESRMLAEIIQTNLSKRLSTPNRGVKSALFYVLRGLEAPAVLVELGFISNPTEEGLFRKFSHRQLLAELTGESVLQFKKDFDLTAGFTR
jgi:N-acetylmuramoyl-L-alanine amidase